MTIEFKILEDYKKENTERAERLSAYQKAATEAKSKLTELTTQYEILFSDSIKTGKDATTELAEIDGQITAAKEKAEKLARDEKLAYAAMPKGNISPVDVVEEFREYTKEVRALHVPGIEARLKLARDLVISAIQDAKELAIEYDDVTGRVKEISKGNHEAGRTSAWMMVDHPITNATILRKQGTTSAVYHVLEDISKFTFGTTPADFEYVAEAPTIKGGK